MIHFVWLNIQVVTNHCFLVQIIGTVVPEGSEWCSQPMVEFTEYGFATVEVEHKRKSTICLALDLLKILLLQLLYNPGMVSIVIPDIALELQSQLEYVLAAKPTLCHNAALLALKIHYRSKFYPSMNPMNGIPAPSAVPLNNKNNTKEFLHSLHVVKKPSSPLPIQTRFINTG
ncbi:hypothetical protein ACH5RR_013075 [Cinchona calisaya]|uniref:Uncharacterized protein n=1 Tax=Cinchona calisaya TaxID=153742 RepID=A0ABD3A4Q5_9GENT